MFEASAPGSIMLMGEHAVLHGYFSIVAAIDKRIKVTLTPRADSDINIFSENFGKINLSCQPKSQHKKFRYVIAAIKHFENIIPCGFDLHISSNFSAKLGLGSSAAVTVATLGVLQKWLHTKVNLEKLCQQGVAVIRKVQNGLGSGADVAASVYGGVIAYRAAPMTIEKLEAIPEVSLIYAGYKTPTVEVIEKINCKAKSNPNYFSDLYNIIGDLVLSGIKYFKQGDWYKLGELFSKHYDAQRALGVSDEVIEKIINELRNMPEVFGSKISGAGLGDCVVALGKINKTNMNIIDVKINKQGIIFSA